jgi:hypothetical protein
LFDIFVRSVMQYACAVWGTPYIDGPVYSEHAHIKPLLVFHRTCLKTLLFLPARTPTLLLHVLCVRPPLKILLSKLILRYYKRLCGLMD